MSGVSSVHWCGCGGAGEFTLVALVVEDVETFLVVVIHTRHRDVGGREDIELGCGGSDGGADNEETEEDGGLETGP